jgi:hypothetical protein
MAVYTAITRVIRLQQQPLEQPPLEQQPEQSGQSQQPATEPPFIDVGRY